MKPNQVFYFTLILFLCLGTISLVYPAKGIRIGDLYTFDYPSLPSLFLLDTVEKKDFTAILENDFDIDSIMTEEAAKPDSLQLAKMQDSIRRQQLKLHYPGEDKSALYALFAALDEAKEKGPVRIMHYGDSQIEGDRITGYLRYKLQSKFGGNGPGLIAAVPLVSTASIKLRTSENWSRYTMYGKVDTLVTHSKYGPLATFGRFTPILPDSIAQLDSLKKDTTRYKGWISLERSGITYSTTKIFNAVKILSGNNRYPVGLNIFSGDSLIKKFNLPPSSGLHVNTFSFPNAPEAVTLEFEGKESPDVYGISLEGKKGVLVDNIAMRGSSGTLFRKIDRKLFAQSLNQFNVKLLILQFGGNVMPYIETEKEIAQYGRWMESQLTLLKSLIQDVSIIVIGPSDMGTLTGTDYQTYPLLGSVRDELKKVTLAQGGVYWDLYEAMGGENSMKAWVEATPPLAGKDFVHFNHQGANKVAQMFYNALIQDYNIYKNQAK